MESKLVKLLVEKRLLLQLRLKQQVVEFVKGNRCSQDHVAEVTQSLRQGLELMLELEEPEVEVKVERLLEVPDVKEHEPCSRWSENLEACLQVGVQDELLVEDMRMKEELCRLKVVRLCNELQSVGKRAVQEYVEAAKVLKTVKKRKAHAVIARLLGRWLKRNGRL